MSLLRIVAAALPAGLSDRKTLTRTMIGAQHAKLTNFSSRISEIRLRNSHRSQPGPSSVHGYGPQFTDIGTTTPPMGRHCNARQRARDSVRTMP